MLQYKMGDQFEAILSIEFQVKHNHIGCRVASQPKGGATVRRSADDRDTRSLEFQQFGNGCQCRFMIVDEQHMPCFASCKVPIVHEGRLRARWPEFLLKGNDAQRRRVWKGRVLFSLWQCDKYHTVWREAAGDRLIEVPKRSVDARNQAIAHRVAVFRVAGKG